MLIECDEENIEQVLNYIGNDYEKCLYLYIDLMKYGLDNENFKVWIQYDGNRICGLISEYYNGMQIYSKSYDFIAKEMIDFIKKRNPTVISGMKDSMYQIKNAFLEFSETCGVVAKLTELKYTPDINAYSAPLDELKEIVKLVVQEENLGKHTGYDLLYRQFCDRKKNNFGRNVISRDENGVIICHAATYAELPGLAVVSGVITSPPYRGKGYSKATLAALCDELLSEDKVVFSYFHIPPAIKMHYGVGFTKIGDWVKFKKSI